MEKQIRQYGPDGQATSGAATSNVATNSSTATTSTGSPDEYDAGGTSRDSDEDESGVDRREKNAGDLTGTDKDETGPGENMATES